MTYLTDRKFAMLKLPLAFSEKAWLETVYIYDFLTTELSDRLLKVIKVAYQELMSQRDFEEPDRMYFDFDLYPASGERTHRVCLGLCLVIERQNSEPHLLRITLKDEMPAA
jgi:hypothetical protein